jgi:hypothetical protein
MGIFQNCILSRVISSSAKIPEARAIEFMKWARCEGARIYQGAISRAAEAGNLEAVKWLLEEYGWQEGQRKEGMMEGGEEGEALVAENVGWGEVISGAAKGGHMDLLLWAKEQGRLSPSVHGSYIYLSDDLEILEWLEKEKLLKCDVQHLAHAFTEGNLDALKWFATPARLLRLLKMNSDEFITFCQPAMVNGKVEVVKWFFENFKFRSPATFCDEAAKAGNFELLKFFQNNGAPWLQSTCSRIAHHGNLWNKSTCAAAAGSGHLEILQWARVHGCRGTKPRVLQQRDTKI